MKNILRYPENCTMIKYQKDTDNIVTLTLDMSGRNANVINHEIGDLFLPVLQHLQEEKSKGKLRGVILTSAKKTFLSGGDLEYLYQANDPAEIFHFTEKLKRFLRDLESPGVPVVAAINGTALGAGFELALGCHRRILLAAPRTYVGLPEVLMGLIPGAGGIIRLMWLLGIEQAYAVLTEGRRYSPHEALEAGIVDELADNRKDMLDKAKAWLMRNKEGRRPWDRQDGTIPGGTAKQPAVAQRIVQLTAHLAEKRNFLAPQAILNVLTEGSKVDFDTACRIESRYYTHLLRSSQTKNMIKAFWFDFHFIEEGKNRPKGFGKFRPRKAGVIGAGQMGSGIVLACVVNGIEVVLKDVSKSIAERGREFVANRLNEMIAHGRLPAEERAGILGRIRTTETSKDFEHCDLVIEAVFENRNVKQKVTKEAEMYMDEYSIFGSNTVSIPITKLAETSVRPENYVGLHFFHPAEEVPLVEIVRGARTSDETIARAFDFVRAIRKTPIIVKDDWGFYAARVQNTYILEGITMLQEGYPPALIENIGQQAGMPKGPLAMADDIGLELALRYEQQAAELYGAKYIQHPAVSVLAKMLEELQRPGRARKAGFYSYEQPDERQIWPGLQEHFPVTQQAYPTEAILERFLFAQVIEAMWCMQEGVIESVAAANLGSIHGWGFPAFKGGVIQYVHDYGPAEFVARCKVYETGFGQRFRAPKILRQMAEIL
ncbi:MAG TPA: 3-hydroxyacyl-CoA dehydrogenase NAD-binding domain-containing protein [Saprospiraceae bacterium]|nr:3-hydroxyacyl-CoA dehydrogenase NAD-binding domain-containing protein [Saprospiraceae bacterium]HMP25944.1 3-hydroxyacyl-CoA dehydrogenase NAD-binding domain-containing protein [Saprospiraceae bacterium]